LVTSCGIRHFIILRKIATEATRNIRTVAGLGREDEFVLKYKQNINQILQGKAKKIHFYAFMFGLSLGNIFFMFAGVFYFAAWMVANDKIHSNDFDDIYRVIFAIIFAARTAGHSGALAPDHGEAVKDAVFRSAGNFV